MTVSLTSNQSNLKLISAGIPQGFKLGPFFVSDIHQSPNTNIVLFADYTTIFTTELHNIEVVTTNLLTVQAHLNTLLH